MDQFFLKTIRIIMIIIITPTTTVFFSTIIESSVYLLGMKKSKLSCAQYWNFNTQIIWMLDLGNQPETTTWWNMILAISAISEQADCYFRFRLCLIRPFVRSLSSSSLLSACKMIFAFAASVAGGGTFASLLARSLDNHQLDSLVGARMWHWNGTMMVCLGADVQLMAQAKATTTSLMPCNV